MAAGGVRGLSCETKPICHTRAGIGVGRQDRPCRRRWAEHAKRSQFRPERREGQARCRKRVMKNLTHQRPRQNKPNSRTDSYGQALTWPVPPAAPFVLNKASSPRLGRKRHPVRAADAIAAGNKRAKRSQFPHGQQWPKAGMAASAAGGTFRAEQSQFAPNRPEETSAAGALIATAAGDNGAKRSHFPPVRRTGWIWSGPRHAGHTPPFCGEPDA